MPYIKQDRRIELLQNDFIEDELQTPGELNFIISYLANYLTNRWGKDYTTMSAIRGAIQDAADEYYRRVMVPYEDAKAIENGDVYTVYEKGLPSPTNRKPKKDRDINMGDMLGGIYGRTSRIG